MRVRQAVLVLGAVTLAACAPDDDATTTDAGDVAATAAQSAEAAEARIRELDRQWVDAVKRKDTAAIVAMYAEDGRLMPPNGAMAQGADNLRAAWAGMMNMPNMNVSFEPTTIEISNDGTMAYDIGTYQMAYDGPNGKRMEDAGKYLVVWELRNGEWKVVADMFNSDKPAPGS